MTHQIMPASSPVLSHRSRHHSLSSPMLSPILSPVHFAEPLPYVHGDTMGSYGYTSGYTAGPSYGYAVQQPHYPSGYSSPSRHQSYDDGYYSGSSRRSSSRRRRRSSSYSSSGRRYNDRDYDDRSPVYYKYRTFGDKIMTFFGMPQSHLYRA
ncbi:hypothetical protein FIBSPDRAFT_941304, partial [Athelia psychrophila]